MGALSRLKPSPERVLPPGCGSFILPLPPRGPREDPGTPAVSALAGCRRGIPPGFQPDLPRPHSRKLRLSHLPPNHPFPPQGHATTTHAPPPTLTHPLHHPTPPPHS